MTEMEFALTEAKLVVPPPREEGLECKDCDRRRNDGFCKKIKKHRGRRDPACPKVCEKKK